MSEKQAMQVEQLEELLAQDKRVAQGYRQSIDREGALALKHCAALLLWYEADETFIEVARHSDERLIQCEQRLRTELRRWLVNPKSPSEEWRLPVSVLANWSHENAIGAYDKIERHFGPFEPVEVNDVPWDVLRRYRTPLIDGLLAVVQRFWVDYDKSNPATAPTQAQVMQWLQTRNPDMSRNQATLIDRMARHPSAQSGGNRQHKR